MPLKNPACTDQISNQTFLMHFNLAEKWKSLAVKTWGVKKKKKQSAFDHDFL